LNDLDAAADWLRDIACQCYPASDYAQAQSAWPLARPAKPAPSDRPRSPAGERR
jgi:hypothetical protein